MERDLIGDLDVFERTNDFWTLSRNELLIKYIDSSPVMDVGCGSGILTKQLVNKNIDVYSLDIEKRAAELTSRFNDKKKIFAKSFEKMTSRDIPKLKTIVFADVLEHGITMAGGSSLLRGIDRLVSEDTKMPVWVADDPQTAVVRGCGMLLEDARLLSKVRVRGALR